MSEINLIPRDYGEARRLMRWLRNFAFALAAVAAVTAFGRGWIALRLSEARPTIEHMRQRAKLAADRQTLLAELEARRSNAEARLALLRTLRAEAPWTSIFLAIDQSYNRKLWFDELAYARILEVESPPPESMSAADPARRAPAVAPPRIAHGFDIRGHALEHAALTEFMRAISEQPAVATVRLTDTGLRKYSSVEVVDFSLAATLGANATVAR